MNEIDVARHSLMIDPHLHIWGWEIPVYLFLGGMAAGTMILGAIAALKRPERSPALRWLSFAAPVLVSVGMAALFLDLAAKLHVWRFYLSFRPASPMSWGAWILVVVYPVTLLFALGGLDEAQAKKVAALAGRLGLGGLVHKAREWARARLPRLAWASFGTGVALGIYTGILLSTLGARALWSSALLGPLFLVSGLSTGAAFMLLFGLTQEERRFVLRWDLLAIGLEVIIMSLLFVGLLTGGADGKAAARLLLGGRFTAEFWSLVVIAGLGLPLGLEALEKRLHLEATVVSPVLVLLGGLSLRWILVAAGQA
ncbi:MAG TPA: NrfD/PsrC family molybdoenzyme membrane anchor subunit [Anaeromyxobacteraceae bacterium]|nr:NrfD/PsrC family molybdoenzyme membrane anchor subunit [Anaeromyxobacteraceae bacterium]